MYLKEAAIETTPNSPNSPMYFTLSSLSQCILKEKEIDSSDIAQITAILEIFSGMMEILIKVANDIRDKLFSGSYLVQIEKILKYGITNDYSSEFRNDMVIKYPEFIYSDDQKDDEDDPFEDAIPILPEGFDDEFISTDSGAIYTLWDILWNSSIVEYMRSINAAVDKKSMNIDEFRGFVNVMEKTLSKAIDFRKEKLEKEKRITAVIRKENYSAIMTLAVEHQWTGRTSLFASLGKFGDYDNIVYKRGTNEKQGTYSDAPATMICFIDEITIPDS